jgi:hypothetical protein
MIILKDCLTHVSNGMAFRTIFTFASFYIIKTYATKWDLYLVLPIVLTILDGVDNLFILKYAIPKGYVLFKGTNCTKKSKEAIIYQVNDKIIDILSYVLCYIYFYKQLKDPLLELFIIHRMIGIILFIITYKKYFLVVGFDFVKEYMLYKYFFASNYSYLPLFIILKIIFEYVFHLFIN